MDEHQSEHRADQVCGIIAAVAMCVAALIPFALVAGAKHTPAIRGEDPTLLRSASQGDKALASVISWINAGK